MRTLNQSREQLTPRAKSERGMALNIGELADVTGYSRASLQKPGITHRGLPGGKMRECDFWKYVSKLQTPKLQAPPVTLTPVVESRSRLPSSNLRGVAEMAAALRAPRTA